jgi:hypothetical protein
MLELQWKRKLGAWRCYANGKQAKVKKIVEKKNTALPHQPEKIVEKIIYRLRIRDTRGHWRRYKANGGDFARREAAQARAEKEIIRTNG